MQFLACVATHIAAVVFAECLQSFPMDVTSKVLDASEPTMGAACRRKKSSGNAATLSANIHHE